MPTLLVLWGIYRGGVALWRHIRFTTGMRQLDRQQAELAEIVHNRPTTPHSLNKVDLGPSRSHSPFPIREILDRIKQKPWASLVNWKHIRYSETNICLYDQYADFIGTDIIFIASTTQPGQYFLNDNQLPQCEYRTGTLEEILDLLHACLLKRQELATIDQAYLCSLPKRHHEDSVHE
jgi:hypothetical protein